MKHILTGGLLAAAAITAANSASAADYSIGNLAEKYMTYTTNAGTTSHLTSAYNGVGTVFIQTVSTLASGPNSGYICTGSLLNATTVLTAAHCVYPFTDAGTPDPVVKISFYLPSLGAAAGSREIYGATGYAFNAGYDTVTGGLHEGDIGSGHDVALFTLSSAATGHDTYSIYTGDPLQQYTEVGTGTIGGPTGQGSVAADYQKRTGSNIYEYYGDDVFSDVTHGVVLADFDDGTAAHDVFGRAGGTAQTGLGADEASSSPGDSGGPEFINGQIVSTTSFGITGGIFTNSCGGANAIDPYHWTNAAHTAVTNTLTTNLSLCTNSSVGEIMGNTLTAYNADFINAYLAGRVAVTPVPEPATWALMILGFGFMGYSLRRRSAKVAFA